MVENRPWLTFAAHAVLLLGVLIVGFPVYMTFVASTHDQATMLSGPVPLLPGRLFAENYRTVLLSGLGASSSAPPVALMMFNSLVMALAIALGKIAISIIVGLCDRLFQVSVPNDVLLDDLRHADAAGRGANTANL